MTDILNWDNLAPAVDKAFAVWTGRCEQEWAKRVWDKAVERGLADYSTDLERHRVIVRFVTLAAIYHDFCELAWEEVASHEYAYWTEDLGISAFHLGQLIGQDTEWNKPDLDEILTDRAFRFLANREREQVYEILIDCFGDVNKLYDALLRTTDPDAEEYEDAEGNGYTEVNTPNNEEPVYHWLQDRCPPIKCHDLPLGFPGG